MIASEHSLVGKLFNLHWPLIGIITLISLTGFAVLYSAADGNFEPWAIKQILRFLLLFPLMLAISMVPLRIWLSSSYVIYGICLVLLVLVEVAGTTAMGATRWIRLGPLTLQPSELMKVCIIFALARYYHFLPLSEIGRIPPLLPPILMILVPMGLIMKQPDLGTSLILAMLGGLMLFAAGVRIWKFLAVGGIVLISMPFAWHFLHDYQKDRIRIFLDPESDPLGDGYNVLQSKIAIGSGGFTGKGFLHGSQSQLSFLPEKQTDFIFTMFSEEFGFVGSVSVIIGYALILTYSLMIAQRCRSQFGRMIGIGVMGLVFLHVFVNIAMTMGLLPIVGVPLPLLSYGGTIMMTILIAFGLLLSVHLHEDEQLERSADDL